MQGKLKARWVWIPVYVAYVALVIAAAATYWMAAPPTYEVSAIISVKPGLYGVETATLRADQNARSQVALLESEDVIRQTIDAIGAAAGPAMRSMTAVGSWRPVPPSCDTVRVRYSTSSRVMKTTLASPGGRRETSTWCEAPPAIFT